MRPLDLEVVRVALDHHQIITRDEFLKLGSRNQLQRRLNSGFLERKYEAVYRLAGGEETWKSMLFAACAAGGRYRAVSFRALGQMYGLPGGEEIVEITTRRHNRTNYDGIVTHESRYLEAEDIVFVDRIACLRPARLLCDYACLVALHEMPRSTFEHALMEAARRELVDLRSVWAEHERLGGEFRLGGEVMHDVLRTFQAPVRSTDSTTETRVLLLLREAGLPEPIPQYWVTLPDGERIRLDFAWPVLRASLEWDPYWYHGNRDQYERMAARTRKLRAMQWERVSLTDSDLDAGMPESLAAIRAIFTGRL